MRLLDLNLLLYATNADSPQHQRAKRWLQGVIGGSDTVALEWVTILGFIRISTARNVFAKPLDPKQAFAIVDGWLARPNVVQVHPGSDHWRILRGLLSDSGAAGNLTTDAHLAALAIEYGCELCSSDADFARFPRLEWMNPLRDDRR